MRYTGPKDRLSRREATDLFGKGAKLTRLNVPPGMHGQKGSYKKQSDFGRQLREKQKTKRMYVLTEKQFEKYVKKSQKLKNLLELLERRLDNAVFRLGFAPTRFSARQLVSHKHVCVNGGFVNIPSYETKEGEVISLDSKSQNIPEVKKALSQEAKLPGWLERKGAVGKISRLPEREDVTEGISEHEIIEFYSR